MVYRKANHFLDDKCRNMTLQQLPKQFAIMNKNKSFTNNKGKYTTQNFDYKHKKTNIPSTPSYKHQSRASKIFICGSYKPVHLGAPDPLCYSWKSPSRLQERSPGRKSGGRSPPEAKAFADIVYMFWLQKRSKV